MKTKTRRGTTAYSVASPPHTPPYMRWYKNGALLLYVVVRWWHKRWYIVGNVLV